MNENGYVPDRTPPVDLRSLEVWIGLFVNPGSLSGKLQAIWQLSQQMILAAERDRESPIRKAWGDHWRAAVRDDSMLSRASVAAQHGLLGRQSDQLLEAYFGALGEFRKAQECFDSVQQGEVVRLVGAGAYEPDLVNQDIWHPDQLKIDRFLNEVVPCFFALQLHCYSLVRILDSAAGVPLDRRIRVGRAQVGGKGSAHGKEYFKEKVLARLIERRPVPPRLSVPKFVEADPLNLASVLAAYQDEVTKGVVWGDDTLAWGRGVTMHSGVKNALNDWSKDDPDFYSALKMHCELRVGPVEE